MCWVQEETRGSWPETVQPGPHQVFCSDAVFSSPCVLLVGTSPVLDKSWRVA